MRTMAQLHELARATLAECVFRCADGTVLVKVAEDGEHTYWFRDERESKTETGGDAAHKE